MWWELVPASTARCRVSLPRVGHRPEELLGEIGVEVANALRGKPCVEGRVRPAGEIDRAGRARLVHGKHRVTEAPDARTVTQRLVDGLPEHDAGVLDGVVRARLEVALGLHVEVEPTVAGERVEEVIEEADPGGARALSGAVEGERERHVGLACGAVNVRGSAHARRSIDSACTGKPSARARAAPAGASRAGDSPGKDTRAIRRRNVEAESAP